MSSVVFIYVSTNELFFLTLFPVHLEERTASFPGCQDMIAMSSFFFIVWTQIERELISFLTRTENYFALAYPDAWYRVSTLNPSLCPLGIRASVHVDSVCKDSARG